MRHEHKELKERQARMNEAARDLKTNGFKADRIREMKRGKRGGEPAFRHGNLTVDMDDKDRVVFQIGKARFKFTEDEINTRLAQMDHEAVLEKVKQRVSGLEKAKTRPTKMWGVKTTKQEK